MVAVQPGNPLARVIREIRLTILPIEWNRKYPKFYVTRWLVAGTIVAALTGNLPLSKMNPFAKNGRTVAQDQIGKSVTSIVAYPLPLTIAITRWLGSEANHVCTWIGVNCDINPGRNLHWKVRSPFVKATPPPAPPQSPPTTPARSGSSPRAP
jgi:hypothetical protein